MNDLQGLDHKFNFADAATAQLQVFGFFATLHLKLNFGLHVAQTINGGEIQIAAEHKGFQQVQQMLAGLQISSHRTCFQPGVAFPITPRALEIMLHGIKRQHQAAAGAKWPQAQIHTMAKTISGHLIQQCR